MAIQHHIAQIACLGLIFLSLLGCTGEQPTPKTDQSAVDIRFSEFYDLMGGERVLGKNLGASFQDGSRLLQFTENALIIYDENLPSGERFNFEPLGASFQVSDPRLPAPENQPEIRYLNGHVIFAEFVPLFDQLGGVRFVGNPLTEVRLNIEKSRYEQYFEKMGFYQKLGDESRQIFLLPYGLIACRQNYLGQDCSTNNTDAIIAANQYLPQPFLPIVQRLGEDFTGQPLSQPYQAADGFLEQIYENVVLAVDPNNLRTIGLRSLPALVGIQGGPLMPAINDNIMAFVPIDPANNLGHNVPTPFLTYVAAHGGIELAGLPISELYEEHGIRRQCFTNYCLDYDPAAPEGSQIRPTPLGHIYLGQQSYQAAQLRLAVWESQPTLAANQEQTIGVLIYNTTPNQPMENLEPTLDIFLPDGSERNLRFPPTTNGGTAYLTFTLGDAKAGETVSYQVCVSQPGSEPICATESWLVR